jgi:glycosyltransferase involved in cell wall biosynthesis
VKANKGKGVDCEIIVVDNCSTDSTARIARDAGARVFEKTVGTIGRMRNVGARASRGEVLVFLDADVVVPDGWLKKAKEYYAAGYKGALAFALTVPDDAGWVGRTWGGRKYLRKAKSADADFLPTANLFVNREVFDEIGGFDEKVRTGEDKLFTYMTLKAGYRAVFSPEIEVLHLGYERGLGEFIRKEFWRQGSTLEVGRMLGFSARTLRNPALSLYHLILALSFLAAVIRCGAGSAVVTALVWATPSALITLVKAGRRGGGGGESPPPGFLVSYFALSFVRWNVAGAALAYQLRRLRRLREPSA